MLWIKAFHIIAMVCWFAGLFYLPRLFVYHASTEDQAGKDRFHIMERKLYRGIMNPSMMVTVILGLAMLIPNWEFYKSMGWMHVKLTLVAILIGYHIYCGKLMRRFATDDNHKSHVFYRWFNEFPVLILLGVVILVVVRPF
ncbi:protoporphyrinogen oxidase HemJ [Pelagibaculum spongiae]|uniref:Protoporphyrinogen IX oxidase n=1 Tax=Pelagibaculum spongiae TaxID=2080658 RepID=A0A2V1GZ81_9GAMM|nr:protoporphyrinogen oxidase HemJ [Pelagibaculum spongiae]PVZ67812.1 protoporphyrinogen oxidase HemJ [Pelagibaculum spongiae]